MSGKAISINELTSYILEITALLGHPLHEGDFRIEDLGIPHRPPTPKEVKGKPTVYMFFSSEWEPLKIGKVGSKSAGRFCYMNYKLMEGIKSSLVRSLIDEGTLPKGSTPEFRKNWICNNTRHINIYLPSDPSFLNGLIESAMIYRYQPKFEKNDGKAIQSGKRILP